jgi:hypothetical protein
MNNQIDYVAEAKKLPALQTELSRIEARKAEIRQEVTRIFSLIDAATPDFVSSSTQGRFLRKKPLKPRPVDDKLSISAGRAVVLCVKKRVGPEATRIEAIKAASIVAKKYGLAELPVKVVAGIDKRIKLRFNLG